MNKTTKTVLITVLACMLVFGGVIMGINWGKWFGNAPDDSSNGGSKIPVDPNAGEYVAPKPIDTSEDNISIPGWGTITIAADTKNVTVDFYNPESNEGKYDLTFELRLKDSGEVLYTSGLVKAGLHIQQITLKRALSAGTYDAIIHVQPYKTDEAQTPTNNADMETKLIVVN